MPEFDEEDLSQSRNIVSSIMGTEERIRDLPPGLSIVDVESALGHFLNDLDLLSWIGRGVPAWLIADRLVPVSLRNLLGRDSRPTWGTYFLDGTRYPFRRLISDLEMLGDSGETQLIPVEQARENVLNGAIEFVALRISQLRRDKAETEVGTSTLHVLQKQGGARTFVSACNFSVLAKTAGLSAHWSGAYFIASNYHAHPTSPATAPLQAGTYVFGVSGGAYGNIPQFDTAKVCSLPGSTSVHLDF